MKIGIDLGTSYSLVARTHPDGSTTLVPDFRDQDRLHTPSVVLITGGSAFVGAIAEDIVEDHPELPILRFFKRHLGSREPIYFDDDGTGWHAEGIGALILDKLRFDAETEVSRKVDGAVITVPAHFNDVQRKAVTAAAALANLPLQDLLEEPVAAALHYGVTTDSHERVLFAYDFGGGTFDATAMTMNDKGIYVLAKTGDTNLGGKELDERVGELILDQFQRAIGRKLDLNARTLLELRRASEALKIELSTPGTRNVRKTVLIGSEMVEIQLDREHFSRAIEETIERTIAVTRQCLRDSGLAPTDVSTLLLVGGSSLVPDAGRRLREIFTSDAIEVLYHEPSKSVALGAALRSAQIDGDHEKFRLPPELKGVTGYSVGVRAIDPRTGEVTIDTLIRRNMPLPTTIKKTYYTARDDQQTVVLDLVQHRGDPAQAVSLGNLTVGPLRNPRAGYPIGVRIDYREDGTVHVVASDASSGAELQQSFGGDPEGDVEYYVAQRKQLQSILMTRP